MYTFWRDFLDVLPVNFRKYFDVIYTVWGLFFIYSYFLTFLKFWCQTANSMYSQVSPCSLPSLILNVYCQHSHSFWVSLCGRGRGVGRGFLGPLSASWLIFMKSQARGQDKQAGTAIGLMVFSHFPTRKWLLSLCSPCMLQIFCSSGKLPSFFFFLIQLCSHFDSEYDWHI